MGGIHRGRLDAGEPRRPGRAHDLALQRMGIVRLLHAPGRRPQIDENATVLDLDGECRDAVVLETRFAGSGGAVEFPVMPGTDNEVAIEMAVAERTARMVAGIGDRPERAVPPGDREFAVLDRDAPQRRPGELRRTP